MSEPAAKPRPMINLDEFERRLRRPAAMPQSQDDPLAELARLVGGHEDPFKRVFEQDGHQGERTQRAAAVPPATPRRAPVEPYFAEEFGHEEDPSFHGTIHPQDFGRAEPAMTAPQAADFAPASAGQEDYAWPEMEAPAATPMTAQGAARRSRRPLFGMAAVIAIGIMGIGASFAYKSKSGPHEIATIKAMSGPTKIQPDAPGGVDVPNQDASVLNKTPQPAPTGLSDHRERPVDLSLQQGQAAAPTKVAMADTGAPAGSGAASIPVPPPPAGPQTSAQAPAVQQDIQSYGIGALIEPKKVKTVSVRSDGSVLPNDTPPQMPAAAPPAAAPAPHTPAAAATTPKPAASPKSTARVVTTPKPAEPVADASDNGQAASAVQAPPSAIAAEPAVKPKPAAVKPVKVAAAEPADDQIHDTPAPGAAGGEFAVQFAAPASEQEAHEMTSKLAAKFGGDLSGHRLTYHRAKVGDKTVFRVRTSGLSRAEATSICQKVQGSGGACFVAKD